MRTKDKETPTRITLVISSLAQGGAEKIMSALGNALADAGDSVLLVTLADSKSDSYALRPEIRRTALDSMHVSGGGASRLSALLKRYRALRFALQENEPDVVISFGDSTNLLTLLARRETPVIISERVDPRFHDIGLLKQTLRRVLYRKAALLVVQTQATAAWARDRLRVAVSVIPNPVVTPRARKDSSERTRTVAGAGRLDPQKGFDLLIGAFSDASAAYPEWDLKIYGEGRERPVLEELARVSGVESRITFCGHEPRLLDAFAGASIFVLSSRYEGFPNVLLEAMASGMAVISFDCPSGPAEIINDGIDGLLVPAGDRDALAAALRRLMGDESLRVRLGDAARRRSTHFDTTAIMPLWRRAIDDALSVARPKSC